MKKIVKETIPPPVSRRAPLKDLIKNVAVKSGLSADMLSCKGRQPCAAKELVDLGKSDTVDVLTLVL